MGNTQATSEAVEISVKNIGGIGETDVELQPGVSVLTGRNATNRTSLLRAIMIGLGSTDLQLKADADHGQVSLRIGDETYTRELTRQNGSIQAQGNPYLDDCEPADLFAFLLESNKARRAVERQDDFRDIIMQPIDTDSIEREIRQLESERDDLKSQLNELDTLAKKLPNLEERRTQLLNEIEEQEQTLETKEEELNAADVQQKQEEKEQLDDALEELNEAQSEYEDVKYQIGTEEESITALEDDLEEYKTELDGLSAVSPEKMGNIDEEVERLRSKKQRAESSIDQLQSIIQFNEEMLEGTNPDVQAALSDDTSSAESVTDSLLDEGTSVVCWTCGSEVPREEIEATVQNLRDVTASKRTERDELRSEIERLTDQKRSLKQDKRQRERLQERIDQTRRELEERKTRVEELQDQRESLEEEISSLEATVSERQDEQRNSTLDLHKEINELEFELDQSRSTLDNVENEIDEVERKLSEREALEKQKEEIQSELRDLRTYVDRLEEEAVDEFNSHMDELLRILDYDNIDRIWIERIELDTGGRRSPTQKRFELHVVRSSERGSVYEDTVDHLSESEREVTGLVFALAGYLVHELYEDVPFMLLDSLEAIDSDRIAQLVEYFSEYTSYLIVALLPEDTRALPDSCERIIDI